MKRASRRHTTAELSKSLHQQLNAYALAAGAAGVGVLALTQSAQAKIVYTPTHISIEPRSCHYIDLNHDGINDFCLWRSTVHRLSFLGIYPNKDVTGDGAVGSAQGWLAGAIAVPRGTKIGDRDLFNESPGTMAEIVSISSRQSYQWQGQWANGGKGLKNGYLGLRFMIKGKTHFGWARVTVKTYQNFNFAATLTGYAYETIPGKAIIAGATKDPAEDPQPAPASLNTHTGEPASLGVLALGAPGLSIWRREESVSATPERN
jgi:hypothetical protein